MENKILIKMKEVIGFMPGWEVAGPLHDRGARIGHIETGAEICVTEDWKGNVSASGSFPRDENGSFMSASNWRLIPYSENDPRIGFNIDKEASRIAKDLEGRLAVAYVPMFLEAKAKLAINTSRKLHREQQAGLLAAYMDEKSWGDETKKITTSVNDIHVRAETSYEGKFKIELTYVTLEQAKGIIDIIKEM